MSENRKKLVVKDGVLTAVDEDSPGFLSAASLPAWSRPAGQVDQLQGQLRDLTAQMKALIEQAGKRQPTDEQLKLLEVKVEQIAASGKALTAPVVLPRSEDLAVQLVSAGALSRLDEYSLDFALHLGTTTLFAGAALSVVGTILSSEKSSSGMWLLFVILTLCAAGFGMWSFATRKRYTKLKRDALRIPAFQTDPAQKP